MKRTISIILLIMMILGLLAGCQQTPESPIVIGKDNTQMIEAAKATPALEMADMTLAERYGIPSALEFTLTGADGKLDVTVDAAIDVPEEPLPILRVKAAEFDQETVSRFWDVLVGDTPMVEWDSTQTKEDIEQRILYLKRVQAGAVDSVIEPDEAQEAIDELEAAYANAPESVDMITADGALKLNKMDVGDQIDAIRYYAIEAHTEDYSMSFHAKNNYDNDEPIVSIIYDEDGNETGRMEVNVSRGAGIVWRRYDVPGAECGAISPVWLENTDTVPEEAAGLLATTPDEAIGQVKDLLARLGVSGLFAVSDVYLIGNTAYDTGVDNGIYEPTACAYYVDCVRLAPGSRCLSSMGVQASGSFYSAERSSPEWSYESFVVRMDDSGIFDIAWSSPIAVEETVAEGTALMPFSNIQEILQKMILVKYEPSAKAEHVDSVDVNINKVSLGLWRVAEQGTFDTGLLVPVWNFYGSYTESWDGYSNTNHTVILTVNAIDGSIIDPMLGY